MSPPPAQFDRRNFLGAAGATTLLCTIGGKQVEVSSPEDVRNADASAAAVRRPKTVKRDPVDGLSFGTPSPQPGGQKREYWIVARPRRWDISPHRRDEWMNKKLGGRQVFKAFVYQAYSAGFADPIGPARMPGPTLRADVGDTIVVHFRNEGTGKFRQAVTMHPHGVKYTPDYDGAYLGDFTRVGGFVAPGEEFTYTWEATPESVGVWPYHDHGPNHTLNTMRGLFGAIIIRPRGVRPPDVEKVLFFHSFPSQVTGIPRLVHTINGHAYAGNAPTVRAKVGQTVAFHVIGGDANFHTFHLHGHRWKDPAGQWVDNPGFGPNETVTAAFREDNPGRWLYHCHVFNHQDAGMAGWYLVEP